MKCSLIAVKGSTLHDLMGQPNLNPYWAKVLGSRCLGKMSFLYIKYFRSLLLMLVAMIFVFFSVVLVLSELMSPIEAFAAHSPCWFSTIMSLIRALLVPD